MTTPNNENKTKSARSKWSELQKTGTNPRQLSPVEQSLPDRDWQVLKMQRLRSAEKSGDTCSANLLRTEILRVFDAYLRFMANSYARKYRPATDYRHRFEDLYSTAKEALMIAIERWDEKRGIPTGNLASRWISGSCKMTNAESPHNALKIPAKVRSATRGFKRIEANEGPQAAFKHLDTYRFSNSTSRSLRLLLNEVDNPSIKLDAPANESGRESLKDFLPDPSRSPVPTLDLRKILEEALSRIEDRRIAFILYMKHPLAICRDSVGGVRDARGEPVEVPYPRELKDRVTLATIANYLKLTRGRIRQIESEGLHQLFVLLRQKLSTHDLNALFSDEF